MRRGPGGRESLKLIRILPKLPKHGETRSGSVGHPCIIMSLPFRAVAAGFCTFSAPYGGPSGRRFVLRMWSGKKSRSISATNSRPICGIFPHLLILNGFCQKNSQIWSRNSQSCHVPAGLRPRFWAPRNSLIRSREMDLPRNMPRADSKALSSVSSAPL
jgi:hypothetical protein